MHPAEPLQRLMPASRPAIDTGQLVDLLLARAAFEQGEDRALQMLLQKLQRR